MSRRRSIAGVTLAAGVVAAVFLAPMAPGRSSATYAVAATDFDFRITPARVRAGTQTFVVTNRGEATHDFKIGTKKTRILDPGQRQTIRVTLRKGRRYAYICTVPGHADLGMKGTLVAR
jgi:uncharacterized cupredoxin-like copper-binding protein